MTRAGRVVVQTSTCADSDPPEKYLNDQRRTTLATVGYVLLALLSVRAARTRKPRARR